MAWGGYIVTHRTDNLIKIFLRLISVAATNSLFQTVDKPGT